MINDETSETVIGVSFTKRMPLSWQSADNEENTGAAEVESLRNERLLQLFFLFNEHHAERRDEEREHNSELERVETKLDAVIQLLGFIIGQRASATDERLVTVAAHHLEWDEETQNAPAVGNRIWTFLEIDPRLPQSLKMAGSVVQLTSIAVDRTRVRIKLEDQGERVQQVLEKLIFRIHRREIARLRSKGVI